MAIRGDTEVPDMQSHFTGRDPALDLAPPRHTAANHAPGVRHATARATRRVRATAPVPAQFVEVGVTLCCSSALSHAW